MAIDKSKSPMWVKVVSIIAIIAMVMLFMSTTVLSLFTKNDQSTANNAGQLTQTQQINQQFQQQVDLLAGAIASDPTSYTALVNLGNTYFDWGVQLEGAQGQGATAVNPASQWLGARNAYERALKVKADDPIVLGDYSVTLYYTNETTAAIVSAEKAVKLKPDLAPAWANLGNYYKQQAQAGIAAAKAKAIAAYRQYLKLEPSGQQAQSVQASLKELGQ